MTRNSMCQNTNPFTVSRQSEIGRRGVRRDRSESRRVYRVELCIEDGASRVRGPGDKRGVDGVCAPPPQRLAGGTLDERRQLRAPPS
jgi:hypothetical protein